MKKILFVTSLIFSFFCTANAAVYYMPTAGTDIIGQMQTITVKKGDSVNKIRQKYGISYHELLEANPLLKPRRLRPGQKITIPTEFILPKYRQGIVINTVELRLYYFTPDGRYVFTTPVGLGRSGWRTPTTAAKVIRKEKNPTWYVPESIAEHAYEDSGKILPESIPPGPENPLGKYAIYLSHQGYLIHGTNAPYSVGKYFSSGCIRVGAAAIKTLYEHVAIGTPVHIVHHANKAGWFDGDLYLESHMPVSNNEEPTELNLRTAEQAIKEATLHHAAKINWQNVDSVVKRKTGIPVPIGHKLNYVDYGIQIN